MRRICLIAIFAVFLSVNLTHAQQLLETNGWGSLSGKATLNGPIPPVVNLAGKMVGQAVCLAAPANQKVDQTWVVDPKTKAVANVVVWIKPPAGKFFPTHENYKKRNETVVLDQPFCAFIPRVSAFNPVYRTEKGEVATGQKMLLKNSSAVAHNAQALGDGVRNIGFNINMPPMTDLDVTKKLEPQPLPLTIQCNAHPWMAAKLHVFDHPYYAITKEDGTFEIPIVPAGAEVSVMAYHEGVGYLLTKQGKKMTIQAGKNTLDLEVK